MVASGSTLPLLSSPTLILSSGEAAYRRTPYTRSITMAMPWPTPMHMVQSA